MADIELTEAQTEIYEILSAVDSMSKKKLGAQLKKPIRSLSSPLKALVDRGVLVTDDYGDYAIAAGVREEVEDGYVSVPSVNDEPEPVVPLVATASAIDDEQVEEQGDDLYSEYWTQHPEELVTFYGDEGLDALKRHALTSAMHAAVGVGQKALEAALHWYDIDEDVRRDPTALMRALEDAGVKHNLVGRIARETFLPEKQYGSYLQSDSDPFIDRGRPAKRRRAPLRGRQARGGYTDDEYDEYSDDEFNRSPPARTRHQSRSHDDDMPWWAENLMRRMDVLDSGGGAVIRGADSDYSSEIQTRFDEQNVVISQMRETLSEHETERKISGAIRPLVDKIAGLEKHDPAIKSGMTDDQFKMQTEKEIFQDISTSVENTVSSVVEPVLEGIAEVQRMQSMREIIALEHQDKVPPGTYLKYMSGGGGGDDEITKNRVTNTIDKIKNKTRGTV